VLTAFLRAFRTPDLRKKLLFTFGIIALFRLGSTIPAPGIDYSAVQICVKAAGNGGIFGRETVTDSVRVNRPSQVMCER
jgi:preprotein translocase subunit SecY